MEKADVLPRISCIGSEKFYISRGYDDNAEYMRSDGKWMKCMDGQFNDWASGGTYFSSRKEAEDALASAVGTGPVRTVTRKEVIPGVYGKVQYHGGIGAKVFFTKDPTELRAAAATLIEIADALEDV